MADVGVGVFIGRKNNCVLLALVYMRGRRGGTDVFVCSAFKNSFLGGGEIGCSDGCCCRTLISGMPEGLRSWVNWGQGAVDPKSEINRFLW